MAKHVNVGEQDPEYGNEQACSNCGDEWSPTYDHRGLCVECSAEWEADN